MKYLFWLIIILPTTVFGQNINNTEFFILDISEACQGEGYVELSGVLASDTSIPLEPGGRFEIESCNNTPCLDAIIFDTISQIYSIDITAPEDSYLIAYIVGFGPFEKKFIAQFDIQAANSQIITLDAEVCKNNIVPLQANPQGGVLIGEGLDSLESNGIKSFFFNSKNLVPDSTYRMNYFYQITTASGLICSDSSFTDITVRDSLGINTQEDSLDYCTGAEIIIPSSLSGDTTGLSLTWFNPQFDSISNKVTLITDTITSSGSYYLLGINAHGCTNLSETVVRLIDPPLIECITTQHVNCFGDKSGQIAITSEVLPFESLEIMWSDGSSNAVRENLSAGIYSVTVTDPNGCQSNCATEILEPEELTVECTLNIVEPACWNGTDGTNAINITGGTAPYQLSIDSINYSSDLTIMNLTAGEFTVFVIDENSCLAKCQFSIGQPDEEFCTLAVKSELPCYGENSGALSISHYTGDSISSVVWNNGERSITIDELISGTYTVTITNSISCETVCSHDLTQPPLLEIDLENTIVMPSCYEENTGSISLNINGGTPPYNILWFDGETTLTRSSLSPGDYTVTIVDTKLCTYTEIFSIQEYPNPLFQIIPQDPLCHNDSSGVITITVPDDINVRSILWSNGHTEMSISNLRAGNYMASVSYQEGCTQILKATLSDPLPLQINLEEQVNVECYGESTGHLSISTIGGTAPYDIIWNNGVTRTINENLSEGSYSVTVTDSNLCEYVEIFSISQNDNISLNIEATHPLCHGDSTGSIILSSPDSERITDIRWSNGAAGDTNINLAAGNYSVTVAFDANCSKVLEAIIVDNPKLEVPEVTVNQINCFGDNSGSIHLEVIGGVPPYQYLWSNGGSMAPLYNVIAGDYSITITDSLGCKTSAENIIVEQLPDFTIDILSSSYCLDEIIELELIISGNPNIADIQWNVEDNNLNASNENISVTSSTIALLNTCEIQEGQLTIHCQLTDIHGCIREAEVQLDLRSCFDLAVLKTVLGAPLVEIGEPILFNIQVHNQGEATAYDVIVEEIPDEAFIFEIKKNTGAVTGNPHDWIMDNNRITTRIDSLLPKSHIDLVVFMQINDNTEKLNFVNNTEIIRYRNALKDLPRDEDDELCAEAVEIDDDISDDANGGQDNCADDDHKDGAAVFICPELAHSVTMSLCGVPEDNPFDILELITEIDPEGDGDGEDKDGDAGHKVSNFFMSMTAFLADTPVDINELNMALPFFARLDMANGCSLPIPIEISFTEIPESPRIPTEIHTSLGDSLLLFISNPIPEYEYQWQHSLNGTFSNIIGETRSSLILNNIDESHNERKYRVMVSNVLSEVSCAAISNETTIFIMPDVLACKSNINVGINNECGINLGVNQLLNGNNTPDEFFLIQYFDIDNQSILTEDFSAYINQRIIYSVVLEETNVSCWGYINLRDLIPPTISCPETITVDCYMALDRLEDNIVHTDNCSHSELIEVSLDYDSNCPNGEGLYTTRAIDEYGNTSELCQTNILFQSLELDEVIFPTNQILDGSDWDINGNGYPDPLESGDLSINNQFALDENNQNKCNISSDFEDIVFPICTDEFIVLRQWRLIDNCMQQLRTNNQIIRITSDMGPSLEASHIDTSLYVTSQKCEFNFVLTDSIFGIDSEDYFTRSVQLNKYDAVLDEMIPLMTFSELDDLVMPLDIGEYYIEAEYTNDCNDISLASAEITVSLFDWKNEFCKDDIVIKFDSADNLILQAKDILSSHLNICGPEFKLGIRANDGMLQSNLMPNYYLNGIPFYEQITITDAVDSLYLILFDNTEYQLCKMGIITGASSRSSASNRVISERSLPESDFTLTVYPNPFVDEFSISISSSIAQEINVSLYAITGEVIFSKYCDIDADEHNKIVPRSYLFNLDSGLYMLVATGKNKTITKQIIRSD